MDDSRMLCVYYVFLGWHYHARHAGGVLTKQAVNLSFERSSEELLICSDQPCHTRLQMLLLKKQAMLLIKCVASNPAVSRKLVVERLPTFILGVSSDHCQLLGVQGAPTARVDRTFDNVVTR